MANDKVLYFVATIAETEVIVYEWREWDDIIPFINKRNDIKELYVIKDKIAAYDLAEHKRAFLKERGVV